MAVYRKPNSKYYYFKFDFRGQEIRRSTRFTNKKDARIVEAKVRSELQLGHWGILEEKQVEVTLAEFLKQHFVTGEIRPKIREYYAYGVAKLLESDFAKLPLKKITKQDAQKFVAKHVRPAADFTSEVRAKHLENGKFSPSSVNCVLRTLKRALSIAHETGYLAKMPKIELAKNERHRDRVISDSEQQAYFKNAAQPCHDVAMIMVMEGARPEEISTLDWKDLDLSSGGTQTGTPPQEGMIHIRKGKGPHAKRDLLMTSETQEILARRFEEQGRPKEGWVFPAPTKSGHIEESSIRKQHVAAIKSAGLDHFELYCFRHTFLTVLGASGCDPYTLCTIAGHGDIKIGMRYCHTQNEYIVRAFRRMREFRLEGCQFRCQPMEEALSRRRQQSQHIQKAHLNDMRP